MTSLKRQPSPDHHPPHHRNLRSYLPQPGPSNSNSKHGSHDGFLSSSEVVLGSREESFDVPTAPGRQRGALCLASVLLITLTGGSINTFSFYGPRLLHDLHLTQYHIGSISTIMMTSAYSLIPVLGRLCQLTSPGFLSSIAAVFFGLGFLLLAWVFDAQADDGGRDVSISFTVCAAAFSLIGAATSAVVMGAMAACAKTFERSPSKGIIMSVPTACIAISGMVESQVAVRLFSRPVTQGYIIATELDVVRFCHFLAPLLFISGLAGSFGLRMPTIPTDRDSEEADVRPRAVSRMNYGAIKAPASSPTRQVVVETTLPDVSAVDCQLLSHNIRIRNPKDSSTPNLLRDPVLWLLAVASLLLHGVCEVFSLNVGSIMQSTSADATLTSSVESRISQHVAILAISTMSARFMVGFVFDRLCDHGIGSHDAQKPSRSIFRSPFIIVIVPATLGACGMMLLASLPTQSAGSVLDVVSCLVGLTYGAGSSLALISTLLWSSEQFPMAFGIINMTPAAGIGLYSSIYAFFFELRTSSPRHEDQCFGWVCYGAWAGSAIVGLVIAMVCVIGAGRVIKHRHVPFF